MTLSGALIRTSVQCVESYCKELDSFVFAVHSRDKMNMYLFWLSGRTSVRHDRQPIPARPNSVNLFLTV